MGIKGIYNEIGPGERIALSKLAAQKFEECHRPLRLAIDISIWQFQIQSGGSNPALRTLYYRLLRLICLNIQPIFVFDGPDKPALKRDRRTYPSSGVPSNLLSKQLLDLFGFPYHIAPGEAEAECALLQQEGIVDAVLSEDVDTLMFGCQVSLRNWSSEGPKGSRAPTHVSLYDAKKTRAGRSGLNREGMVLVAMMSGGDYNTAGINGCGIKIACEAARAGFGESLCALKDNDTTELKAWRDNLVREFQTNDSKYFRVKHKALEVPESFPDWKILKYYTHPTVSSKACLDSLKQELVWDRAINLAGLRTFVAETFHWRFKPGAKKLIRGLAPALVVRKLSLRCETATSMPRRHDNLLDDAEWAQEICGIRKHFDHDGLEELRVYYVPLDVVGLDLEAEESDEGDEMLVSEDEDILPSSAAAATIDATHSPDKRRQPSTYDPSQLDKTWVLGTFVRRGLPGMVEKWEGTLRQPKKAAPPKSSTKRGKTTTSQFTQRGAMDRFVKVTKPDCGQRVSSDLLKSPAPSPGSKLDLQAAIIASAPPTPKKVKVKPNLPLTSGAQPKRDASPFKGPPKPLQICSTDTARSSTVRDVARINPWTLSRPSPRPLAQSQEVNRQLDFLPSSLHLDRHLADPGPTEEDEEFPELRFAAAESPTTLSADIVRTPALLEATKEVSSSPVCTSSDKIELSSAEDIRTAKVGRTIALRESLDGAWKEVDEIEARTRRNVWKAVEVIDLS